MPIYRYQSGSTIDEMTIVANESGGVRAYLHGAADANPAQLQAIAGQLIGRGWKVVPTLYEGKPTLEWRGFNKPHVALDFLAKNNWVRGNPAVQSNANDTKIADSQKWANLTLRFAGFTYIVGDSSYIWYTFKKAAHDKLQNNKTTNFFNRMDIAGGFGYILGSAALAFYGSRDQSQNTIRFASKKIENYMRKEGFADVSNSTIEQAGTHNDRGFWGNLDHAVATYPSETLNSIYVGVGGALSSAAIYRAIKAHQGKHFQDRNTEIIDIGLGAVTATSAIAGLAIKEKKREEGDPPRKGLAGVWDWIQEKPLRATGYGYMVATLCHAVATLKKWREGDSHVRETAVWRGVFVAANVVSEILMALSSKGHGTGVKPDESIDNSVIASTAEAILRQPESKHESMIQQLSGFMASRDVLGGQADDIAAKLREHVEALQKNPWVLLPKPLHTPKPETTPSSQPGTRITEASQAPLLSTPQQAALTVA